MRDAADRVVRMVLAAADGVRGRVLVEAAGQRPADRLALGLRLVHRCIDAAVGGARVATGGHHDPAVIVARGLCILVLEAVQGGMRDLRVPAVYGRLDGGRADMDEPTLERVAVVVLHQVETLRIEQPLAALLAIGDEPVLRRAGALEKAAVGLAGRATGSASAGPRLWAVEVWLGGGRLQRKLVPAGHGIPSVRLVQLAGRQKRANAEARQIILVDGVRRLAPVRDVLAVLQALLARSASVLALPQGGVLALLDAGDRLAARRNEEHEEHGTR